MTAAAEGGLHDEASGFVKAARDAAARLILPASV